MLFSTLSLFACAAMAQSADVNVNISEPVFDYTAVNAGETTSGKISVSVNGSDSDAPYTISGSLNLNAGGDVFTDNWDGSSVIDKTANAVTLNVNSGTIQTRIYGQCTAGTNVYGNVLFNINGGVLGKGTQQSADCNIISGLGEYVDEQGVKNPTVVIYGNSTVNIGTSDTSAAQPTIYGYITTQGGAIVKGNTYLNIMGGHITHESNTYSNVYGGPNYKGTVEGSVYVNISGGTIDRNVHGGGIADENAGKILGSTNITISGGTILGDIYGAYSGAGGSANGTNITLIGDGSNIRIDGVISGGNRGTDDCSLLGTKTLYIGNSQQAFTSAEGQSFKIQDLDLVRVSRDSSVAFSNDFSIDKLVVELGEGSSDSLAQLSISEGAQFNTLTLVSLSDFSSSDLNTVDLTNVFGDNTSLVLASMQDNGTNLTLIDSNNQQWSTTDLTFGDDGSVSFNLGSQIPEPSTYALIFGALALAFCAYRKRG